MKLDYINDIAETTRAFMIHVIDKGEAIDYEVLMKRLVNVCATATEHGNDTIDIDYKHMCFTVHLNTVLGRWQLCKNASYYIIKGGLVHDAIDIELF